MQSKIGDTNVANVYRTRLPYKITGCCLVLIFVRFSVKYEKISRYWELNNGTFDIHNDKICIAAASQKDHVTRQFFVCAIQHFFCVIAIDEGIHLTQPTVSVVRNCFAS